MQRYVLVKLISSVAGKYDPKEHPELFTVLNWSMRHLEWRGKDLANIRKHEAEIRDLKHQVWLLTR